MPLLSRPRLIGWRRFTALLGVLVVAFLLAAVSIVALGLWDHPGQADLAVVLGNEVLADGRPSARLAARLDRALELYRAGGCRSVLVSGGVEPNGNNEARVMRAYLVARAVPADRIIEDPLGVDTYSTARTTRRILHEHGWQSVCVVTQYYHVPRARYALHRFGVRPVYSVHARYFEWRDLFAICREVAGFVKYPFRSYYSRFQND